MKQPADDVLVVGAGPVGLTMAAELVRHGVRPLIIDRRTSPSPYCRALGVTPRTLEVWDEMGIVRPMIDAGIWLTGQRTIVDGQTNDAKIDLSDLPYSMLGLPQYETERVLAAHVESYGVHIERGVALENLALENDGVRTTLCTEGGDLRESIYRYVVGCDGAHSTVRQALGIAFEGDAFPFGFILGDVHLDWNVPRGLVVRALRPVPDGPPEMFIAVPLPEPGRYRVSMLAPPDLSDGPGQTDHGIQSERPAPALAHLQAVADRLLPERAVLSNLRWSSTFRISMRLAAHYRSGRAFLAGDAAHVHPPTGGQGMNTGIQDAYNLGWKLARVVRGVAPESLLDSYEAERRPVGEAVVTSTTAASVKLGREEPADDDKARLADTQVLINYRTSGWVGDEASLDTATGPRAGDRLPDCEGLRRRGVRHAWRLFDAVRGPEHVLIAAFPSAAAAATVSLRGVASEAQCAGLLRLVLVVGGQEAVDECPPIACYVDAAGQFQRVFGAAPGYILVRPDGYLGWRGTKLTDPQLSEVLRQSFR